MSDVIDQSEKFALVPHEVIDRVQDARALALYVVLKKFAHHESGEAHPSRSTLAQALGVRDRRSVDKAVQVLEDAGLVRTFARFRGEQGQIGYERSAKFPQRTSNGYVILKTKGGCASDVPTPVHEMHKGCASGVPTLGTSNAQELKPLELDNSSVKPPRQDVEEICTLLADLIEANGSKRPTITGKWRDAARLLIDKDGRTPEDIKALIEWVQADEFWRSNVLSMPKLRSKFDQLRLKAGDAAAPKAAPDDAVRLAWKAGDASGIAASAGLVYPGVRWPDEIPTDKAERDRIKLVQARRWIEDNRDALARRLGAVS